MAGVALTAALEEGGRRPSYAGKERPAEEQRGLAPKTIRGLQVALHSGFERAKRHSIITRNPADGADLPAAPRRRKLSVGVEDVQRLLMSSQTSGDRFFPLWVFLATTGLRIGEALALRWQNMDLDTGWFTVSESIGRGAGGGTAVDDTKTETSDRDVPLTAPAVAELRAHRAKQSETRLLLGAVYDDRGIVFATSRGTPFTQRNALRALKAAAGEAKVTDAITLHDLRRLTASILVASGVDIATAAAIMGHRNASVLLDVYAKALPAPKVDAMSRVQTVLFGQQIAALPG